VREDIGTSNSDSPTLKPSNPPTKNSSDFSIFNKKIKQNEKYIK
jgi:hypothetical protein